MIFFSIVQPAVFPTTSNCDSDTAILKCKHQSFGVCGEQTPELCLLCNKGECEEVAFGLELKNDARFVVLKDCGHTVGENQILTWMKPEPTSTAIQLKRCPHCSTTIRHTKFLNRYIALTLRDIDKIKTIIHGSNTENKEKQKALIQNIKNVMTLY